MKKSLLFISIIVAGVVNGFAQCSITLSSVAGTDAQTKCINTAITDITYSVTTGTSGVTVTGLPAGVIDAFAADVVTISGTASVAGTFTYTVDATGGCPQVGMITINPDATISLTSAGTDVQAVCNNTAITSITYSVTGGTDASVTGLPAGVSGAFASGVVTISGTPSIGGTFNYIVTTGTCVQATATGTITANQATIGLTSAGGTINQVVSPNSPIVPITYLIGGTGTGAVITYLPGGPGTTTITATTTPAGLSTSYSGGVLTISGTPSVTAGQKWTYTVTTTGGTCAQKSAVFSVTKLSCTVDPNLVITGNTTQILPDTNNVILQTPGGAFSQTFSIYMPFNAVLSIMGNDISADVDSVYIEGITGDFAGFTRVCGTPNCKIKGGEVGCFTLTGTMPMTDNIAYTIPIKLNPYGTITAVPAAFSLFITPPADIQTTLNGFGGSAILPALATYTVQVGTPPTVGIESFSLNGGFSVSGNNPNPFDASTTINFNTTVSGNVDFVVIDVLGRQVYDTNINATAGSNTFTFTTDLSSGTYFFSLSDGTNTITRKMIVTE